MLEILGNPIFTFTLARVPCALVISTNPSCQLNDVECFFFDKKTNYLFASSSFSNVVISQFLTYQVNPSSPNSDMESEICQFQRENDLPNQFLRGFRKEFKMHSDPTIPGPTLRPTLCRAPRICSTSAEQDTESSENRGETLRWNGKGPIFKTQQT